VSAEFAAFAKAVTKEAGDETLIFREGHHAVAQIAWGQHVEVAAKAAAGAAIVGNGDDCGEVGDEGRARGLGEQTGGMRDAEFESAQQGGEACASANSDDAQARGGSGFRGYKAHRI
jgi:hypothetical protein